MFISVEDTGGKTRLVNPNQIVDIQPLGDSNVTVHFADRRAVSFKGTIAAWEKFVDTWRRRIAS